MKFLNSTFVRISFSIDDMINLYNSCNIVNVKILLILILKNFFLYNEKL